MFLGCMFFTYFMFSCEFSCSVSSYPAVGSTLHQWIFFINDRITTLYPDPATLLGPRGGFHRAAKEKQGRERCFHEATVILINQQCCASYFKKVISYSY